jgi:hypothetical protein
VSKLDVVSRAHDHGTIAPMIAAVVALISALLEMRSEVQRIRA